MRAGDLHYRVVLQERIDSQDDANAMAPPDWRTIATLPADVRTRNGVEAEIGGRLIATVFYDVMVRYRSDITAKHRLILKGDNDLILNITSPPIDPDGRRASLKLICEAGKSVG